MNIPAPPIDAAPPSPLPWKTGSLPLMLAPMQGLTNAVLRSVLIDRGRPDVVFTEFMRVSPVSRKRLAPGDLREAAPEQQGVPLVIQLIGHDRDALCTAAAHVQNAGARQINLNLGCPYGRMTTAATGGHLLRFPEKLEEILHGLRSVVRGGLSVKLRSGYDNPSEIFALLPLFERAKVDYLILHPRTVEQEYAGEANHEVTAEVVRRTSLPVIANGDIRDAHTGLEIMERTGAAGLMLGRGAIADPLLFERLRGNAPLACLPEEREMEIRRYLLELLFRYGERFCGEAQVLSKIKGVVSIMSLPGSELDLERLRKARTMKEFRARLERIG